MSLKYCGACNPMTNLSKIGNELKEAIGKDDGLKLVSPGNSPIDVMVILCGCPRACGNKAEINALANRSIVVAGEAVDMVPVAEKDISATVIKNLKQK